MRRNFHRWKGYSPREHLFWVGCVWRLAAVQFLSPSLSCCLHSSSTSGILLLPGTRHAQYSGFTSGASLDKPAELPRHSIWPVYKTSAHNPTSGSMCSSRRMNGGHTECTHPSILRLHAGFIVTVEYESGIWGGCRAKTNRAWERPEMRVTSPWTPKSHAAMVLVISRFHDVSWLE